MLKGRCECRVVEFEVADAFVEAYNCHCSNCRAATGSVFKPWGEIEPEKMKLTKRADSLVVQGDADTSVDPNVTRKWVAKMKELGMKYEYIEVPGGTHASAQERCKADG